MEYELTNTIEIFGFLNIYKPKGMTSHDVISRLRKITKIKQIGHTGTLDPFAEGVLPVCIGKSTRLIEYLEEDKEYLATIQFGQETDTYDLEGTILKTYDKKISKKDLKNSLRSFEGEIEQVPPIYSAIKVDGKKLYEYARKGLEVEIKPRRVFISRIELIDFDENAQNAKVLIACSKGTYIRSIAYDLGRTLECGAYLTGLVRTQSGQFNLKNSVALDELHDVSDIISNIINPLDVMTLPKYIMNEQEKERVIHGMSLTNKSNINSDIVFLVYSGKIYAIGMVDTNRILVKKVFEVL